MDKSWWRVLTKCGPLEKGMVYHFSILALRTPWTAWKSKKIWHITLRYMHIIYIMMKYDTEHTSTLILNASNANSFIFQNIKWGLLLFAKINLKHWLYSNTTHLYIKNKQIRSKCFILPTKFQYYKGSKTMIHWVGGGEGNAAINIR